MFKRDFIMDQIEQMAQFLGKIVFNKTNTEAEVIQEGNVINQTLLLKRTLKNMIAKNKINEAENLLFREVGKQPNEANLEIGVWFYTELTKLDEATLLQANFSKAEILEGLTALKKMILPS